MPDSRMSDSYYVKIDDADSYGEHFVATDLVRSTWSAAIQHAAPVRQPQHGADLIGGGFARPVGNRLIQ